MRKGSPDADIVGGKPGRDEQQHEPAFSLAVLAIKIAEKVQELHRAAVDRGGHGAMVPSNRASNSRWRSISSAMMAPASDRNSSLSSRAGRISEAIRSR